ncbi:DNA polymerase [Bacillus thuringiensis]|uniref:DNA polymerase n=1 Tax=Bacillus thuringiensis TaxID=1428 RepID=UPI00273B0A5F|nr:DNA polymerase [Bacillus thuringiensis]WLP64231.1 DNA polymerase [Bacillus thuringiensis]
MQSVMIVRSIVGKFNDKTLIFNERRINTIHLKEVLVNSDVLKVIPNVSLVCDLANKGVRISNWITITTLKMLACDDSIYTSNPTNLMITKWMERVYRNSSKEVLEREINLGPILMELTLNGIGFDLDNWMKELEEKRKKLNELKKEIQHLLDIPTLDVDDTFQLAKACKARAIILKSFTIDYLISIKDEVPIAKLLLKYQNIKNFIKRYGDNLESHLSTLNRIHGDWHGCGAFSGRMSCSKPNLQALPSEAKKYFMPKNDYVLISADYSQQELKMLAELSGCSRLRKAFTDGVDVHLLTASYLFNLEMKNITSQQREIAKKVNCSIIYGITGYGLAKYLSKALKQDVTLAKANQLKEKFFEAYPNVFQYQDALLTSTNIFSKGGRTFNTYECYMKASLKLNLPIQSSSAEGMKEALIYLYQNKPKNWFICNCIHDQIYLEVPSKEIEEAKELLEKSMILGMEKFIKSVPVSVTLEVIKN